MTLTDHASRSKGPPEWIEEDQIVSVQGYVGEDIIVELKLATSELYDDLRFELIRDGLPISSDRYRLSMRANVVQLALKQSQKNDGGYYSLVATRLGQDKGASKKIHMSIDETTYEEGDPPIFLRRLSDLAVKVGTRTRFLVEIRSATTPKVAWYKNDAAVQEGPRFSLVHEGNFYCVDVVPVTVEDQGRWTCMAENRCGRSSCTSTLTVVVPKAYKKPEFIEELRALLTETGTVSLECKVVGVPTPVLRWFKDNKEIKAGDVFALTANPDDPTSLGVYTCEAVNCMGTAYSSSKVHVVGRGSREGSLKPADAMTPSGPLPVFKQILQDECCRIGDNLLLSCRVQVPPWPRAISWYNKGGRVEPSEKYHIMEDGIGGYSIEVKQVEAVDEGEWKCVATSEDNMKQITSCYVAMSIPRNYRKPRFMENLKAVLTEEGLVSFECKVVGFPTPLLRWFKDGQELKPGDVYQLTGTNSLGSYCCIARNCMGEAKSTAELTVEDIQNQLNEEERFQLLSSNQPPKFIKGLRSCEARINDDFQFTIQVSVAPEPNLSWYRDDAPVDEGDKYRLAKENLGVCHLEVRKLEFIDQAEWKCVAANDFGHSVTSCFLKLIIPKHYKKPKFLESLRAILSEEGAVNLECKVIGVPQPVLKWYKDNAELKPGDIHRIISGQDGTCCLGTYTCEATNCMGTVSSSASLLGYEDKKTTTKEVQSPNGHELARNLSLSTIHEERTSQLYDTPQTDHSVTLDERGEVSFSFDGKEVSVSLYETPDLTEEEALQIVEMYADQLSEHVTEHNVIELPPMRFVKETSTSGNLLMEAVVIDVSPDYFVSAEDGDDLRTEADFEDVSIMDDQTHILSSPERDSRGSLKRSARFNEEEDEKGPSRPPRKKSTSISSSKSERSQRFESESFHSAQKDEPPLSPFSSLKQDDSDTFADALSSAHLSITERHTDNSVADNRKRSLSTERTAGSSLDDGIGGDSSFDSVTGAPKKRKHRKKKQRYEKDNSEEYSGPSDYEGENENELEDRMDAKTKQRPAVESIDKIETDIGSSVEQKTTKRTSTGEDEALDNSRASKKAAATVPDYSTTKKIISDVKETSEPTEDILLGARTALREASRTFEKISGGSSPRLSNVRQRVDEIYGKLEISRGREADMEILRDLETSLRALLKTIGEMKLVADVEIVRNILEPSVVQLSRAVGDLQSSSLQPTLAILKKIHETIRSMPNGTEVSSSVSEDSRKISKDIVDPLINVQATFSTILDRMEQSKRTANGTTSPQQALSTSGFAACLIELRECVSHAAHTAMTLKENETLNSLMEFTEPLLDLQLVLASEEYTPHDLSMIRETTAAIENLKSVIAMVAKGSEHPEAVSRVGTILKTLEDTGRQMSKLAERLSEVKDARKHTLKSLNVDQSLSGVHFALSSILEKQNKRIISSHLIGCIETLRQAIGSSAVTIANLKNPLDDEIMHEIGKLNGSLLNLQKNLLTEKYELEEEAVLCSLLTPINTLKEILFSVVESGSSTESTVPMLQLLEEIEKDTRLVTKEISKRRKEPGAEWPDKEVMEKTGVKSVLADQLSRSLDSIKHWLSIASEDSTKDEVESILSSTIEELKKDVTKIAIETSYSEPPSDKSLIKALIDLREPLTRLQNAVSVYHEPENLSTLEGLGRPMKHLLQIIMDVLLEHQEEKSLQPIVSIIEQIEDQIPLSIKEALYQQELKQSDKTLAVEAEEEMVTASRETIPGTLTEIPSTPFEVSSTTLPTEQTTTEDASKKAADDLAKDERRKREENASKLIVVLSETLEKLQLEMTGILEDFEESLTRTTTMPQSKLANSLEELRRTISTIRVMTTVYGEEIESFEEKANQAALVLTNLLQPLMNIRTVLWKTHDHDVLELMILNRLSPLLSTIEDHVIRQTSDFVSKGEETEKEFETLLCVLGEIKTEVPVVIQDISSRRKILEHLRDISKPLESILERMSDLEKIAEETLEADVAKILGKPTALFLRDIKMAAQESDMLDRRGPVVLELHKLLEPLLEFHSCLSMVQSSRRSLVPEDSLLEEKRSVILRAVDGLRKQVCDTVGAIASMSEAPLFDESLAQLNSAILQVQKQIGKTDYSRRSSSTKIPLRHRLTGTLNRLAGTITVLEENTDRDTHVIVSKCLEALQKQISLAQTQLIQTGSQLIDEEAIVEGFLYPTNQLLSALNVIKENAQRREASAISASLTDQLRQLADSISEMSSSLSAHKTELVREGSSKSAPIVETFSAVVDVLDHVKGTITAIEEIAEVERKANVVITKVESVTDEIVEVSREEIESVTTIVEITPAKATIEESAELRIEDTPIIETAGSENEEMAVRIEQTEDAKKGEDDRAENEKQKLLRQTQLLKFNSSIGNLQQPLKELVDFVRSATQGSLPSKSAEDKRKIRELTVLIQNLNDLQATSVSVQAALSSSFVTSFDSQFRHMEEIFVDFERAIDAVITLTHGEVRPELKGKIIVSLRSFAEPLDALKSALVFMCETIDSNKHADEEGEVSTAIPRALISCLDDTLKSLSEIQISKRAVIVDEKEAETNIIKIKEETKDIEEITARPLEELIEAIMDSQDQVKGDKTSPLESVSPSTDLLESKDDSSSIETEAKLSKAFVEEVDSSATQVASMTGAAATPQQASVSPTQCITPASLDQSEELPMEEKAVTPASLTQSLEEVEELKLASIVQQMAELRESSGSGMIQEGQVKIETLRAIICPLQEVCKTIDEIGETVVSRSPDEQAVAFSTLVEPLLNLELTLNREIQQTLSMPYEGIGEIEQDASQKLSVTTVLEELQRSIATVQEQVQLSTVAEGGPGETPKARLMQAVEQPLEDLKMSIACIQSDTMTCHQEPELTSAEHITVLQTVAKTVEDFGDKCMSIINQLKIESVPPSPASQVAVEKEEDQKVDSEVLHKIVGPIHVLRETLSQLEDLQDRKVKSLEISGETKQQAVQLSSVTHPLEKLEQSLTISLQQIITSQESQVAEELGDHRVILENAKLKPVLEELKNSIMVVQRQAAVSEDVRAVSTINEALEALKMPLATVEEIVDHLDEVTETETVSTLLTFAKSVEETANQLMIAANQQVEQPDVRESPLLKMLTIPIEGLQSAILRLEDRMSQTLETEKLTKAVALECMLQPLQQLQRTFLTAPLEETALSLQQLPIKPTLDDLSRLVAVIQDRVTTVQDKLLPEASSDDLAVLKDFARSLGDLRTSTVVLQQLNAIENAGQQIIEIENASALQAFAKSIEEFRRCCSVTVERPRIVEAFATSIEQSAKVDAQLLENIIAPLRILQEQILIIEETKMQQSEILDTLEERKPTTVLSSLVGPLQQLEKSFVATVQKENVIEAHNEAHRLTPELSSFSSLEKLALQPILEEVQRSIATVQEHVILEAGSHVTSEAETAALLRSIAQPLVDLRASVASVQQVTSVTPDTFNELGQQQNVSALETFAENLHNLAECIAMCNHQQIIMEPAADTISEDASSLNTWADMIEEPVSRVTRPMVVDQGTAESPASIAVSISEEEASVLKTLAKPLTELKECLALIVEERKIIAPSENASSMSENQSLSLLKTMIRPLLELKDAAAIAIQEQTAMERASEHSFAIEGKNECTLRPLMEPLEELRHSIAVIHDQMLIETSSDQPGESAALKALAEPLFNLQRSISVLEARVMSPDVESMPDDTGNWIAECLATPLHEIERSIADIRQCTLMEPAITVHVEEQARTLTPDWSIVERLVKPMADIKAIISHIEGDSVKTVAIKTLAKPLESVQENLTLLRNKADSSTIEDEGNADAVVEALSNLEKCISFVERKIVDKSSSEKATSTEVDAAISSKLSSPLSELKRFIVTVEESPSEYLKNLERPLELVQNALETVSSVQRRKRLADLSTKLQSNISDINDSIEIIGRRLEDQQVPVVVEVHIECEALGTLTKPLRNIKRCIAQMLEEPNTANLMTNALQNLEKSISLIQEQSADKPLAESQDTHFGAAIGLSKNLAPCLHEMQDSIEKTKTLWQEKTMLEGLMILEEPLYKMQTLINIMRDQFLVGEIAWIMDEEKIKSKKKLAEEKKEPGKEEKFEKKEEKEDEKLVKMDTEQQKVDADERSKEKEEAVTKIDETKKDVDKVKKEDEQKEKKEIDEVIKKEEKEQKKEVTEKLKEDKEKKVKELEPKKEDKTEKEDKSIKEENEEAKKKIIEKKQEEPNEKKEAKEKPKEEKTEIAKSEKVEELEKKKDGTEKSKKDEAKPKVEEPEKKKDETEKSKKDEAKPKVKEPEKKKDETEKSKKDEAKPKVEEPEKKKGEMEKSKKDEAKSKVEEPEKKKDETEKSKKDEAKPKVEEPEKKKGETEKSKKDEAKPKVEEPEKKKDETEKSKKDEAKPKVEEPEKKKGETEKSKKDEAKPKEEKIEKTKSDKVEELEKQKEEFNKKEEVAHMKMKEKEQKKTDEVEEPKKDEATEKLKQEEVKKVKSEKTEVLKKKEEEPKEKDKAEKATKENEKQKQPTTDVETKTTPDEQTKVIDTQEKAAMQRKSKRENKIAEKEEKPDEEHIERKREEIPKTNQKIPQTSSEHMNDLSKEKYAIESERQYKKSSDDREREEETYTRKVPKLQTREDRELKETKREEERAQRWPQDTRSDESRIRKEKYDRPRREADERLNQIETERSERKRDVSRFKRDETDNTYRTIEERPQRWSDEKWLRKEENARLLREEEKRLRMRREEEIFRSKQRREEQIREIEWSRKRQSESDRFLRDMLETRYRPEKSTSMFFDVDYSRDKWDHISRLDSGVLPMTLSSASRSYSWRDSLTSLTRRRFDDYWDYKLRNFSTSKYHVDTGPSYRRRRRRENHMLRARSISLLKYEDYSTGDSDATLVPSTRIRHTRRTKTEVLPRVGLDSYDFGSSSYVGLSSQSESLPSWEKPKKPSFCTRLTNRTVGIGMRTRLTCTVLGHPEPRVHWMKDGDRLDTLSSRYKTRYENGMAYLEVQDALPEDAGLYTCVAENTHGTSTSESTLKVYSDYKPTYSPPTFVKSIKDIYRYSDHKLVLECRVRAYPTPTVSWWKDGTILQGQRYRQTYLDDDVYRLEIIDPVTSDNGQYTCRAANDLRIEEVSHMIRLEDRDRRLASRSDRSLRNDEAGLEAPRQPRFSNLLKDYSVPAGGTIALQVEVQGEPVPEVRWFRGDRKEPIAIPKAKTFVEHGLHTLIVPEATESERGTYFCRAINAYGQVDTSATVDVISSCSIDGGKPAVFVSRVTRKSIDVIVGEDVSVSFRVSGVPKPRVTWMKGLTDITDGPRSYKETIDDYVRLTLKRALPSDEGTYCILVKNRYGCDRCFFSIKVKQRARSLTPSQDWSSVAERDAEELDDDMSYVRNVPGPISSEPVAVDGGKNWLSLTWGKAERRGPAPVIAYKVEAWLLGGDGGARWVELGITPINTFDAFNLRPGGEYKFRVTPRNRYGWGEPVTMINSVYVSESTDLPEFTKILPGQLKALEGTSVKLECEIRGDSKTEVRWYRETMELDSRNDSRFSIHYEASKCSLTIANVNEDDSGRYVCEASNRIGKVSSFARVLVVNDPRIIEADAKLRTSLSIEPEDRPPQFTMRIRDRRVQSTYPVRLTCQVIGHPVPEITWYKNDAEISQDDHHIFWDDDSNFHTLEIIHSTLEDSGCYMAAAKNINGSVSCRCTLVVDKGIRAYIAPEFLRDLDAAYTVQPGEELRMSAQLEAYPSVGVVWHRDGIRLRPSRRAAMTLSHDGTVHFSLANVTDRDAGVYSCTATNAVGHTETTTRVAVMTTTSRDQSTLDGLSSITSATPDIPYSKEPLFVTKPLSTEAVEGDTVIILCEVVGDPKPEVIWLRDFLKPDYYRDAPHFRLVGAGPQYRLEIPYAKLDFTGTYSVIARNCHGEAKAVISLQIYAKGQGKEDQSSRPPHGKVLTLPIVKRELRDLRCCDGDAVSFECKVYACPEPPLVRWERGGKIIAMVGDFVAEFDGETARLSIQHVYPEDEGEYTCVAYNDLGKAYTSACLVVDVPEGKENILNQRLTRPVGLLSEGSTPRSTPRSTPIRSLSPAVSHGREFRSPQMLPRRGTSKRSKVCPPKFYSVPHNRLVQEGETVRFQCAVVGHPAPWVRWDKNGTIVTPSARVTIKERDDVKILEIVDVMREDAALYRVTAENDFGRIEASARLEVISRYESTSRTIRTRSASPRTYPTFDRSLLPTTSRINGRLQLECRVRGTPSVTPTWYRNGRPLERTGRVKRHFDGATAKIEISKVKASDAGEYTCVATNVLGSTRNSCQVSVLHPHDPSIADKEAPRFPQPLPEESIVMENHPHEFQTGITGTPPFTIAWSRDGRELPDNDCHKYVVYGDGGVALRLREVRPQDAGEYTCVVRNDFGVASCGTLFAVQDYKDIPKLAPQFTKTPLSVITAKGSAAYFCARVQCGRATDITWTINGRDARENAKCKIERAGDVSILRIRDVTSREAGEIRCTASASGKGPSVGCVAKLRLQHSSSDLGDLRIGPESGQSYGELSSAGIVFAPGRISSPGRGRPWEESRVRSSSFPRRATPAGTKQASPLPRRRNAVESPVSSRRSRFDVSARRNAKKREDISMTSDRRSSSSSNERVSADPPSEAPLSVKREQLGDRESDGNGSFMKDSVIDSRSEPLRVSEEFNEQEEKTRWPREDRSEGNAETEEPMKAAIIKEPGDVIVFRGNRAVLRVAYQGRPEPTVKWLRVNQRLLPGEKIGITSGDGASSLTLDDVTYDHAGKYEVSVENSAGKERRFFSLAVEGPPEPPAGKISVNLSAGRATIVWRSSPYDGGRAVTGYTVEAKRAGESTWTVITESCHSLSQTVPTAPADFVVPGESYRFRVRAENVHGLSDPGAESDRVRIPKPGATMLQEEEEDKFEPSFEARVVEPEEGRLFEERYDVHEELGKGRYGIVKKVTERATSMYLAAKFVRTIKAKDREQVREEIRIMNMLRHPKLLLLAAAYESPRETVMVTEYISGGELFERVVADDFTLTERDSILFMRQICEGVEYMHQNKIVHLDLKPENVMCRTRTSHQIKLIDFGLAQTLKPDTPVRVLFGTPEFIPPEIISYEPIGTESDMWSVGVICYVLLTGLSPFMGDNDAETFANITRADYDLEDEAFDAISNDAKDFISGLLIKRKELRMSAKQCLAHPWMAQRNAARSRVALPTEKLKKFIVRRKWQKTGNAIRALGRMAMLSANSRRSPTTTEESSPTLEKRFDSFEIRSPDATESTVKDAERIEADAPKNSIKAEPEEDTYTYRSSSSFVIGRNTRTQKIPINNLKSKLILEAGQKEEAARTEHLTQTVDEETNFQNPDSVTNEESLKIKISDLVCPSDQTNTEDRTSELTSKQDIPQGTTARSQSIAPAEEGSKRFLEKSPEVDQHILPKTQVFHRVLRGDSRDSGIGDCNSSQVASPLQVDELGIESTIKEETDPEVPGYRDGKGTLEKEESPVENSQISTLRIPITLTQGKEGPFYEAGGNQANNKVATKSGVTKASCEINIERKVADESTDARLLSGRTRNKFLPTGNVSRTARIFERESAASKSDDSQVSAAQRAYPAAIVAGKPYNERIQKAFAFWNK